MITKRQAARTRIRLSGAVAPARSSTHERRAQAVGRRCCRESLSLSLPAASSLKGDSPDDALLSHQPLCHPPSPHTQPKSASVEQRQGKVSYPTPLPSDPLHHWCWQGNASPLSAPPRPPHSVTQSHSLIPYFRPGHRLLGSASQQLSHAYAIA
jgi:hypothetical protein